MPAEVGAVVRTYNSAATLAACIASLRAQTVPVHVLVVDSGSSDDTLDIARRSADALVTMPHSEFTYGRALNVGAAAAGGDVQVALSSHCTLPRPDWVEIAVTHLGGDGVAGVSGQTTDPDGEVLVEALRATAATPIPNPFWCFSNHASAWRHDVWQRFAFDESLEASEDAEWSDRVMAAGYSVVFDPALFVSSTHRGAHGYAALYQRRKREARAMARVREDVLLSTPRLVGRWWRVPAYWDKTALRARLNRERLVMLVADWAVGREVRNGSRASS